MTPEQRARVEEIEKLLWGQLGSSEEFPEMEDTVDYLLSLVRMQDERWEKLKEFAAIGHYAEVLFEMEELEREG